MGELYKDLRKKRRANIVIARYDNDSKPRQRKITHIRSYKDYIVNNNNLNGTYVYYMFGVGEHIHLRIGGTIR